MSKDDEFLDLMARANFDLVFVGVESVNEEALKGANKHQNLRGDLCANIHRVLSYGIGIRAGMIVGFDEDGTDIFERQHRFIQDSCLTSVGISILKAPTGTRLWSRLMREGRVVVDLSWYSGLLGHLRTQTNILPKRMSRIELMQGYKWLLERVYPWDAFAERVCGFVSLVNRPPGEAVVPESRAQAVERLSDVLADPEAARAIGRIFDHVERVAPHLMSKARTVIAQHARYSKTVRDLLPEIDRQVQLESSGIVVPKPDRGAVPPSKEFRAEFDRVFPEIHRRVYANLAEKTLIPEALTEIFVDFLVRWGEEVQTIDAHHVSFLHEISDRTCAKLNGVPPESFVAVSTDETSVPNIGRMRLADDIYKNVWMDLSELRLKEIRGQEGARPFSAFLEPASRFGPDDGPVKATS